MISVCIATYNGERYIVEQLRSILPQLSDNDEIVISDDQSTDKTIELIEMLNDSRIKIFQHDRYCKHTFPLDASTHNFENALIHSSGDFIFLADQDDVWLPNKVNEVMNELQKCDFVINDCHVTDSQLNIIELSYFAYKKTSLSAFCNIVSCSWLGCCMAFRRNVLIASLPFPPTQVAHDLWLGLVAGESFKCKLLSRPLSLYRRHDNTASPVSHKSKYSLWFKIRYRLCAVKEILKHRTRHDSMRQPNSNTFGNI